MVLQLTALVALPEDLGSIPAPTRQLIAACNSSFNRIGYTYMQGKYECTLNRNYKKRRQARTVKAQRRLIQCGLIRKEQIRDSVTSSPSLES